MNKTAAILGGPRAVTHDHEPVCRWPLLDAQDEQAVLEILRDGNISTHPVIHDLEQAYAASFKRRHAVAHCNGTAALHAAFFALDLQPGDEVLVPSATFWASVLPMCWYGLVPVFCESEPERLGIDPIDMEQRITPRTKAVVVVHLWGLPSKMTEIREVAKRHDLKIIEDASHTHGASWRGEACGALGDISVFSLQGDKLAPAGEGGVLLCDDDSYRERVLCLGDISRIIDLPGIARRFAATSFGIKTRIAPLSAALGRIQLEKLEQHNAVRNANHHRLSLALEKLGFDTFLAPPHIKRVYFEYIIRPGDPQLDIAQLINALQAEGCRISQPRYPLLHQQPFFTEGHWRTISRLGNGDTVPDYSQFTLPVTESASNSLLRLPVFPNQDNGLIDDYIEAFTKVIGSMESIIRR